MAIKLNTPAKTTISNITYNNIMQDVYNLIQDNKSLRDNWTDYISSDAGRMLTEVFAWVAERLAERIDVVGNELFLETAENKESVLRLLKLVGYKLDFPSSAYTTCSVQIPNGERAIENQVVLSAGAAVDNVITLSNSSFKKLIHPATSKKFEFIKFDEIREEYDYFDPIITSTSGVQDHVLQEGETRVYTFEVNRLGHNTIILDGPVIKNSVSIYRSSKLSNESWTNKKLLKVDNFFSREAQTSEVPIYKVNNLGNGICEVEFPNLDVVGENYVKLGEEYSILYRVGGGELGNIGKETLSFSEQIYLNNGLTRFYINYKNITEGLGGKDELDVEEIRTTAPHEVRNYSAAITEEDYEYILKKNNTTMKDIKVYGEYNITSEEIERAYQYYKNPLDVWLFIIKEKSGYSHDITNITDYVNDITFEVFDLNERLNEIYQVNKADINIEITPVPPRATKYEYEGTENATIYNPVVLEVPSAILEKLEESETSENYKIVITEYPFEEKKANIIPNESNKKYIVNDSNETSGAYPKRYVSGSKELLKEEILASLSSVYSGDTFTTSSGDNLMLTIGDIAINISFTDDIVDVEELADQINDKINAEYHSTKQAVVLIENIQSETDLVNIEYTPNDVFNFKIIQGDLYDELSIKLENADITFESLKDKINAALADGGNNLQGFVADLSVKWPGSEDECYNLVIYSTSENSSSDSFSIDEGTTDDLMNALGLVPPIYSAAILNLSEVTNETKIIDIEDFFVYEGVAPNGSFVLKGSEVGENISIENSLIAKRLFGLTDDAFSGNYTHISGHKYFVIEKLGEIYSLVIGLGSIKERLPKPFYISGFWGKNNIIQLGSYYTTGIKDADIPEEIVDLLERPPIKNLYNTVFNESERGVVDTNSPDVYNSEYELKFTRDKISGYTFEQIGNMEEPPSVTFKYASSDDLSFLIPSDYIRLRVNSEDLLGKIEGDKWDFSGITNAAEYTVDGYVKFNIGLLSGKTVGELVEFIKTVFVDKLDSSTNTSDVPYLYTSTNTYSSSIDFTGTPEIVFKKLFAEDYKDIFYSTGAIIDVQQINYKKIPFFRNYHFANQTIFFSGKYNGADFATDPGINTQTSLEQFKTAILSNSALKDKVIFNNDELVFLSKKNGDEIELRITIEEGKENDLINFIPDMSNVEPSGLTYVLTKKNEGDYYIELDRDNNFNLVVENALAFPYGDIYIHMIEDYRGDHITSNVGDADITYTDEYVWEKSLQGKKMLCVNHVYKQPRFAPFSADITVRILPNAGNNKQAEYREKTETLLRNAYNVYDSVIGENINRNSLALFLERNLSNISSVSINYLGFDLENRTNNLDTIEIDFNEKAIIASNKFKTITVDGELTKDIAVQGLTIKVEQSF